MNSEAIAALVGLGLSLAQRLIESKTQKPLSALTTEEMLEEIKIIRETLSDSGEIFDRATKGWRS